MTKVLPPRLVGFHPDVVSRAVRDPEQVADLGARLRQAHTTVVILGSSISGLVLAARLGAEAKRDRGLAVVLVAGSPPVPRRLVAGCTMRFSTVYRMAAAMSVDLNTMVARLGGTDACFRRLAIEPVDVDGSHEVGRRAVAAIPRTPFAAMSTRHGAILVALRESLDPGLPVEIVDGDVSTGADLAGDLLSLELTESTASLPLQRGRYVVLNATSRVDLLRSARRLPDPSRWVVVIQAALAPLAENPRRGLPDTGWIPASAGRSAPHLALVTPFRDVDNPAASWYGINAITVSDRQLDKIGRDDMVREVSDQLTRLESLYGLQEVDPVSVKASAVVPVVRQWGQATERLLYDGSPVVDVHRSFGSGAPAICADGMLASVVGADAFADAFLSGTGVDPAASARDALRLSDRALRGVRVRNLAIEAAYYRSPLPPLKAVGAAPAPALRAFLDDFSRCGGAQVTQSTTRFELGSTGSFHWR